MHTRTAPDDGAMLLSVLAREQSAHLRWLRRQYWSKLSDDECGEVLQEAYAAALKTFRNQGAPSFPSPGHRTKWWQTVVRNAANGHVRSRDGRVRENAAGEMVRAHRPAMVSLDAPAGAADGGDRILAEVLAGPGDVEAELVDSAERAAARDVLVRAFKRLDPRHVRILRWRYVDDLDPKTICELEGLRDVKAYEGRMRRALSALRPLVAGLEGSAACAELRRAPGILLARNAHVDECVACRAWALQVRGALAATPLPLLAGTGLVVKLMAWVAGAKEAAAVGGAKVAATVAATAAVGGGVVVVEAERHRAPERARAAATPIPTPAPTIVPVATFVATPVPTVAATATRAPVRTPTSAPPVTSRFAGEFTP
jgi:DNA-directed RNA polymerase specialized sigma24 family protein